MSLNTKIYKFINKYFQFFRWAKKYDIIIIDDTLPDIYSGFKIQEFQGYAHVFNSKIYCDLNCYKDGDVRKDYNKLFDEFSENYPTSVLKFSPLKIFSNINTKLAYCLFFNNIVRYYKYFGYHDVNFGYTLYPGGGLNIENEQTKLKIKEIHSSKNFKFVIVNQKITKDYLIQNGLCDEEKIFYIHGTPINYDYIVDIENKNWYKKNKNTFDIAFIAHKYIKGGTDKGLDVLLEAAEQLTCHYNFIKIHIVGNFDIEDIPLNCSSINITFHGTKPLSDFSEFFKDIDLVVSPNKPNILGQGFFDGFPLASSVLAGLHGIPLMLADELNQNIFFTDDIDFIYIKPNKNHVSEKLEALINNPKKLIEIGENGRLKLKNMHSYENQISKRLEIIKLFIK